MHKQGTKNKGEENPPIKKLLNSSPHLEKMTSKRFADLLDSGAQKYL